MAKINLNLLNKKKLIIFDLDGVIINSRESMFFSLEFCKERIKNKNTFLKSILVVLVYPLILF